jgi:hypothetical protein
MQTKQSFSTDFDDQSNSSVRKAPLGHILDASTVAREVSVRVLREVERQLTEDNARPRHDLRL